MTRTLVLDTLLVVALAATVVPRAYAQEAGSTAQPDAAARADASARFQRGVAFFVEGDYDAALIEFERAYAAAPAYAVFYNIGQTQLARRRYPESLRAFTRYLEEGGDRVPAARRTEVETAIATIRDRIGFVEIDVNVEAAEVRIDGELVAAEALADAIAVSVGTHRIEARAPGYESGEQTVTVAGGDRLRVELELSESAPVVATVTSEVIRGAQGDPHPLQTLGIVGLIVAGGAAVAGVATGVLALEQSSIADGLAAQTPADASAVEGARAETFGLALATDLLVGSALVIGGLSLLAVILDRGEPSLDDSEQSAGVRLRVGPGSVGVAF